MQLCSNGHDEVCYEGWRCPACQLKEELEATEKELEKKADQIRELEGDIEALQQQEQQ